MVLTEPGLSVIVDAMLIARGVFQRMLSFLTYRVSATLQLVFFFFIGVFTMAPEDYNVVEPEHPDQAKFFHLPVLMFMLITLLNDGTLMAIGYDNVFPQPRPQKWNLRVLFFIASVLAGIACVSSLLLLWMALDSHKNYESSWFSGLGLPSTQYAHLITMIYLKISISDFLTLFSARTQDLPFYAVAPSKIVAGGAGASLFISTLVASFWPMSHPDEIPVYGLALGGQQNSYLMPFFVWIYCIMWWFVQDACKVLAYKVLEAFDIFGYRTEAAMQRVDVDSPESSPSRSPRRAPSGGDGIEAPMLAQEMRSVN
jgi:H+-transporting ATPase